MSERDELARVLNHAIGGLLDLDMTATDGAYVLQMAADAILAAGWRKLVLSDATVERAADKVRELFNDAFPLFSIVDDPEWQERELRLAIRAVLSAAVKEER